MSFNTTRRTLGEWGQVKQMTKNFHRDVYATLLATTTIDPMVPDMSQNKPASSCDVCNQNKPLPVLEQYKRYGVTKNQVAKMLTTFFHYPPQFRDTLATFYIRHWTGKHFYGSMVDGVITGTADGIPYHVIYQDCTPVVAKRAHQLRLSFRSAQPHFGLPAYVIVRPITEAL